mmetsp:Transcript_24734/g.38158  ORF Transcript_24734/g.38158 Transcript_24734/m.38158 type:complete len:310 (-) Transcript_24734:408-1337(-)
MSEKVEDPFDAFGSDDEESNDNNNNSGELIKRSKECGVLSWNEHTETSLSAHVENCMRNQQPSPELVISAIDEFCLHRHWMMHVGPEKGTMLTEQLQQRIREVKAEENSNLFLSVELGTYCGYSAILLARTMRDAFQGTSTPYHLISVEVTQQHVATARRLLSMAGLESHVTVLLIPEMGVGGMTHDLGGFLATEIKSISQAAGRKPNYKIEFLFIDHEKNLYLIDLQRLEGSGLIKKGTIVVADNVIFGRIAEYRGYVHSLSEKSIVETKTIETYVEYCEPDMAHFGDKAAQLFRDGIEITKYLQDPL